MTTASLGTSIHPSEGLETDGFGGQDGECGREIVEAQNIVAYISSNPKTPPTIGSPSPGTVPASLAICKDESECTDDVMCNSGIIDEIDRLASQVTWLYQNVNTLTSDCGLGTRNHCRKSRLSDLVDLDCNPDYSLDALPQEHSKTSQASNSMLRPPKLVIRTTHLYSKSTHHKSSNLKSATVASGGTLPTFSGTALGSSSSSSETIGSFGSSKQPWSFGALGLTVQDGSAPLAAIERVSGLDGLWSKVDSWKLGPPSAPCRIVI